MLCYTGLLAVNTLLWAPITGVCCCCSRRIVLSSILECPSWLFLLNCQHFKSLLIQTHFFSLLLIYFERGVYIMQVNHIISPRKINFAPTRREIFKGHINDLVRNFSGIGQQSGVATHLALLRLVMLGY